MERIYLTSFAWAMTDAVSIDKTLVKPCFESLIDVVKMTRDEAIKRNIVRIWQMLRIPEKYRLEIADICFGYLCKSNEVIAVKAFSMTALQNLVEKLPEIREEVLFEIEKQLPHSGPAFRVRANAFLKSAFMKKNN